MNPLLAAGLKVASSKEGGGGVKNGRLRGHLTGISDCLYRWLNDLVIHGKITDLPVIQTSCFLFNFYFKLFFSSNQFNRLDPTAT